jgi:hypothetical protein
MHHRYRLVFLICMCPPLIYIAMDLCVTCLVCVCLNRWTHTRAPAFINYFTHTHTHARIHSFFLTLTRGKTMFSHNQIHINPKSYGHVHDVCVKKICVCCMVFAVKSTTYYCCISCSFPNDLPRMCG